MNVSKSVTNGQKKREKGEKGGKGELFYPFFRPFVLSSSSRPRS